MVQHGSDAQRLAVLSEVASNRASFVELCRSPYAHYVAVRLLEAAASSKDLGRRLATALKGNMVSLATHGVGARVVELALANLKGGPGAALRLELYGRELTVFADDLASDLLEHSAKTAAAEHAKRGGGNATLPPASGRPTLAGVLAVRPERSARVLEQMGALVSKLVAKGLLAFQFAHDLLAEYLECCDAGGFRDVQPAVIEQALVLLSTRSGTRAVCRAVSCGDAKDRRRVLKLLKGHTAALLTHRDAYLAVMTLCEVSAVLCCAVLCDITLCVCVCVRVCVCAARRSLLYERQRRTHKRITLHRTSRATASD